MKPVFKELPDRGNGVWLRRLSPLLEYPNRPALVYETPSASAASQMRWRLANGFHPLPRGRWDFRSFRTSTGGEVYATYLGPEERV